MCIFILAWGRCVWKGGGERACQPGRPGPESLQMCSQFCVSKGCKATCKGPRPLVSYLRGRAAGGSSGESVEGRLETEHYWPVTWPRPSHCSSCRKRPCQDSRVFQGYLLEGPLPNTCSSSNYCKHAPGFLVLNDIITIY